MFGFDASIFMWLYMLLMITFVIDTFIYFFLSYRYIAHIPEPAETQIKKSPIPL